MAIHIGTAKYRRGHTEAEGKLQDPRAIEDKLIESIETKDKVLEIAEYLMPLLEGDAKVGDVVKMLDRLAPVAIMRLADVVVNGKSEKAKSQAAKDLLHMAGYKPVEKSISLHDTIDRMSDQQIDGFLKNALRGMNPKEKEQLIHLIEGPEGTFTPVEIPKEEL